MASILNQAAAETLQYISFPLEVIGLALAMIEVRFPQTAQRMTQLFVKLAEPLSQVRETGGDTTLMAHNLGALLSMLIRLALTGLFIVLVLRFVTTLAHSLFTGQASGEVILVNAVSTFVSLIVLSVLFSVAISIAVISMFFVVTGASDFSQRFVQGRAVGTMGILIAGLGVLGEGYQLIVQLLV